MKKCRKCGVDKGADEFHKNRAQCKSCIREYDASRYVKVEFDLSDLEGEIWRPIPDFEGYYLVSNKGRVKSLGRQKESKCLIAALSDRILKPRPAQNKYLRVQLCKNTYYRDYSIHRLVAMAFLPKPLNKNQVNHKDGDKANNVLENVEWCNKSENMRHSFAVLGNRLVQPNGTLSPHYKGEIIAVDENGGVIYRVPYFSKLKEMGFRVNSVNDVLQGRKEKYKGLFWMRATPAFS